MKLRINNFCRTVFNTSEVLKLIVPTLKFLRPAFLLTAKVQIAKLTSSYSSSCTSQNAVASKLQTVNAFLITLSFIVLMLQSSYLFAAAGDVISNTAVINYSLGGSQKETSASTTFTEDRIINFVISEDNGGAPVPVVSNMTSAVMQFTLTNTGNDTHDFLLTALNSSPNPFGVPVDSFDPTLIQVFVESGTTPTGYQPAEDTAVFVDELAAGASITLYVVSSLPVIAVNEVSAVTLIAQSAEGDSVGEGAVIDADDNARVSPTGVFAGTTTPGGISSSVADSATTMETVFNDPAGLNAEDIATDLLQDVVGNGQHSDTGAYQVTSPVVINKVVTVIDTQGGADPHTGSTLRYQLDVSVVGNTAVDEVIISDLVPANTTYVSGSLLLNGIAQTDADDASDFSQAINILTPPVSSIEVDLGQSGASPVLPGATNTIIFEVTIN